MWYCSLDFSGMNWTELAKLAHDMLQWLAGVTFHVEKIKFLIEVTQLILEPGLLGVLQFVPVWRTNRPWGKK